MPLKRVKNLFHLLILFTCTTYAANTNSPIGFWYTMTDGTHHANSVVKIWQTSDKTLSGKIIKAMPSPNEPVVDYCTLCKGENYNKPVIGMTFMWGFNFDGKRWSDGRILDPRSGKIYHAYLETDESGQLLRVHGYIGMPLFGLTKVWERNTHPLHSNEVGGEGQGGEV